MVGNIRVGSKFVFVGRGKPTKTTVLQYEYGILVGESFEFCVQTSSSMHCTRIV